MNTEDRTVIRVRNLDKRYQKRDVLSGKMMPFYALRGVSFDVRQGEIFGIIGRNGSGKSTLLKILSGITRPTEGEVDICGMPSSILDVGTGIHPELTGRENIYLRGQLLGMTQKQVKEIFDDLVLFSGVEDFIDTPMKNYSSGMFLRLAFSIIVHLRTEILFLDEVLAVGDVDFRRKCASKIREIVASGCTVVVVSHEMNTVLEMCTKVMMLAGGEIAAIGKPDHVVRGAYMDDSDQTSQSDLKIAIESKALNLEDMGIEVACFKLQGTYQSIDGIFNTDEEIAIILEYTVRKESVNLAIGITDVMDGKLMDDSPVIRVQETSATQLGRHSVRWTIPSGLFNAGTYFIDLFVVNDQLQTLKKIDRLLRFRITDHTVPDRIQGVYRSAFRIDLQMQLVHQKL
jgi:lipopolysaccharide transport system ATP-binding protein